MYEINSNDYKLQKIRGLKRKYEQVILNGGKCSKCGYSTNLNALEFHHREPDKKLFNLDTRKFSNTNLEDLQEEIDKCGLLCANCHREHHHPELHIDNIDNLVREIEEEYFPFSSFSNPPGKECPECGTRFNVMKGKIYCSKKCRVKAKGYPDLKELEKSYEILRSWAKVAKQFDITPKIVRGIRERA